MFLLCNGLLLVLIAINSAPINASSPPTTERAAVAVHIEEKSSQLESKEPDIAVAAPIAGEETESPHKEEKILVRVEQDNVLSDTQEEEEKEEEKEEEEEEEELHEGWLQGLKE